MGGVAGGLSNVIVNVATGSRKEMTDASTRFENRACAWPSSRRPIPQPRLAEENRSIVDAGSSVDRTALAACPARLASWPTAVDWPSPGIRGRTSESFCGGCR